MKVCARFASILLVLLVLVPRNFGAPPPEVNSAEYDSQQSAMRHAAFEEFRQDYLAPMADHIKKNRALYSKEIATLKSSSEKERVLDETDIQRRINKTPKSTETTGPLFGDEAYEKKLWARLSEDIVARRQLKATTVAVMRVESRRRDFALENDNAKRRAGFNRCDEELKTLIPRRDELREADRRANAIILNLFAMYDARTLRLLAPMMFENDFSVRFEGDYGSGGFTQGIIARIRSLRSFGVFQADWPPQDFGAQGEEMARPLREWWTQNREKFGTVYELPKSTPVAKEPPPASTPITPAPPPQVLTPTPTPTPVIEAKAAGDFRWWIWVALLCALGLAGIRWLKNRGSPDK